jgi:hypothetical protein
MSIGVSIIWLVAAVGALTWGIVKWVRNHKADAEAKADWARRVKNPKEG